MARRVCLVMVAIQCDTISRHYGAHRGHHKPASTRRSPHKTSRKPRATGYARRRSTPTQRIEHKVDSCPDCGTKLAGGWPSRPLDSDGREGWVQRRREVIDIPVVPVQVVEHVFLARQCPLCRKRRVPKTNLEGTVVGHQRLGVNLVSLIVAWREEGRRPVRTFQWYPRTFHQSELSQGAIVEVRHRVAERAKPSVEQVLDGIRASSRVNADETGWRQDGVNGYVWTFSTPTERYFAPGSRGKGMIDQVLGEGCQATLVSDFYAAYNHYAGLKQPA